MAEKKASERNVGGKEAKDEVEHEGTPSSIAEAEAAKASEEEQAAVYQAAKRKARWG